MKKIITLFLTLSLCLSMFAGCASNSTNSHSASILPTIENLEPTAESIESTVAPTTEPEEINELDWKLSINWIGCKLPSAVAKADSLAMVFPFEYEDISWTPYPIAYIGSKTADNGLTYRILYHGRNTTTNVQGLYMVDIFAETSGNANKVKNAEIVSVSEFNLNEVMVNDFEPMNEDWVQFPERHEQHISAAVEDAFKLATKSDDAEFETIALLGVTTNYDDNSETWAVLCRKFVPAEQVAYLGVAFIGVTGTTDTDSVELINIAIL